MAIVLFGIAILVFSGLPALLVITACVSAAQTTRDDEAYQRA